MLVRIQRNLGFEMPGDIVDYRGADLEDRVAAGDMELLFAETNENAQEEEVLVPEVPEAEIIAPEVPVEDKKKEDKTPEQKNEEELIEVKVQGK